jgi:ABC-type branched-subunit amino acid transport system ATPase component
VIQLELSGVSEGAVRFAAGSFGPACSVVTGDDAQALATFVAVASGAATPRNGRVLFDGAPLTTTPAARRRVASALADEVLPPAPDVGHAVSRVLTARGGPDGASDVLAPFGLGSWSRREASELDRDELRSVALALALSHTKAEALILYEPLSTSSIEAASVRECVAAAVTRGAIVVIVTASVDAARSFGGPHCVVADGVLKSELGQP